MDRFSAKEIARIYRVPRRMIDDRPLPLRWRAWTWIRGVWYKTMDRYGL